jgi:tRNA nucleotidyltransferase/poly(A) polymerase
MTPELHPLRPSSRNIAEEILQRLKVLHLPVVIEMLKVIQQAGGDCVLVGGCVRDALLGRLIKDIDIEVYHLSLAEVMASLEPFGPMKTVGAAFGVIKLLHYPMIDISLPRRDSKIGAGHRGFASELLPDIAFTEAARRRDLTINSLGYRLLNAEFLDPYAGVADLTQGRLQATDPQQFSDDPLRGLRVARFAAQLNMAPTSDLVLLCTALDLSELSRERIAMELQRLLAAPAAHRGLEVLRATTLHRFIPGIQHWPDATWAQAIEILQQPLDSEQPLLCRLAALWAVDHQAMAALIDGLMLEHTFMRKIEILGQNLATHAINLPHGTDALYRQLARLLNRYNLSLKIFIETAQIYKPRLDWPACAAMAQRLHILDAPLPPVVTAQHLIAHGIAVGPDLGRHLTACQDYQDLHGITDAQHIIAAVLQRQSHDSKVCDSI